MGTEALIERLTQEGFPYVYTWKDMPNTVYPPHSHRDRVSLFITKGEAAFTFDDHSVVLKEGDRFDVPPGKRHTANVGSQGCEYVVGEMIDGDS